ncbi:Protein of unknown function, partial [Gryllus bimaculatus]
LGPFLTQAHLPKPLFHAADFFTIHFCVNLQVLPLSKQTVNKILMPYSGSNPHPQFGTCATKMA